MSSDAKVESDPVWKRASGGPLLRQASEGGAGKYGTTLVRQSSTDVGKGKPFTRQLSKGVSEKSSGHILSSKGFLVGIFSRGVTIIRTTFAFQKCFG